jgi:hypothetical protein
VIIGETSRFALELVRFDSSFGAVRIWVGGESFGDADEASVIDSLRSEAADFVSRWGTVRHDLPIDAAIDEVRRWFDDLTNAAGATEAEWREIGRSIHGSWLFAYAPEGLSAVTTVIRCDDENCSVTCWDVETLRASQQLLPRDEVLGVIRSFVERARTAR